MPNLCRSAPAALLALVLLTIAACDVQPSDDTDANEELSQATAELTSDSLDQYAQKCDDQTGVTTPDFDCDAGTEVPHGAMANGKCDKPNRLNKECDPGSRFQVLQKTADAFSIAHCRKRGLGPGQYADIAVIQYNRKTGATCFYQALGNLSHAVKAPSKGTSAYPWMTPKEVANASFKCVNCHDNGPIIRSPYLTGLGALSGGKNALPGDSDGAWNRDQPYKFVGNDFVNWKAFKIEVAGNMCNGCHRMGAPMTPGNNIGTALDFGLRSTADSEAAKNPHSAASPIWTNYMAIDDVVGTHRATQHKAALEIAACAMHRFDNPLPNSATCKITPFTGSTVPNVPGNYTAVWTKSTDPEIQVYGWTYDDYRAKYDELWASGWRLKILQPVVRSNGAVRYNAVWRRTYGGEIQVYGWTYADYRAKYDQLWAQGWRLKILQPYVVAGQVRYTAVWQPSTAGEIQVYGWTYADYRAKYDQLWTQGWRLKLIQPYVINGNVRYTAVWQPSTAGEIQVYGWTYADYRAKYDQLWTQGWRLKMLQPYVVDGVVRYTAVWRPGSYGEIQVYGWDYANYRDKYDTLWDQGWRLSVLQTY